MLRCQEMTLADLRHPIASRWEVRDAARSDAILPGSFDCQWDYLSLGKTLTWYTTPRKTRKKAKTISARIPPKYAIGYQAVSSDKEQSSVSHNRLISLSCSLLWFVYSHEYGEIGMVPVAR